ncbi:MAG: phospholipase D-like domain-containing protein [Caldilineaceae bacterium]
MLNLKQIYTTGIDDLSQDFFIPLLRHASNYDRGVGYFSSGWIQANAAGLAHFAMTGGHARWVTSPLLSQADMETLSRVNDLAESTACLHSLFQTVEQLQQALANDTLNTMAWMVADGLLEFRFAVPIDRLDGDFHDKFGIFTDGLGKRVSFIGSYNDTMKGFHNYESILAFWSWNDNMVNIVENYEQRFARIWLGRELNLRIYELPEAVRDRIIRFRTDERPYPEPLAYTTSSFPVQLERKSYLLEAETK